MKLQHRLTEHTPLRGLKINIGGIGYKIKYFKSIIGIPEDSEDYDPEAWTAGFSDLSSREIGLFAYLTPQEHDYVLLHELLHCTIEACKTAEAFQKEDFVKPLSRFFMDTLKQCGMLRKPRLLN